MLFGKPLRSDEHADRRRLARLENVDEQLRRAVDGLRPGTHMMELLFHYMSLDPPFTRRQADAYDHPMLVDCDIHVGYETLDDLLPYLDPPTRELVRNRGRAAS